MTLTGIHKYDCPPVFAYHSPWWSNYKDLNNYYARLSWVISKGVQNNDILVIEPNSTLWSYYSHTKSNKQSVEVGQAFQTSVTTLEERQVKYNLGFENIIKDQGAIKNGQFIVEKVAYLMVVLLPLMETLNKPTSESLQKFVQQGGKVVRFSSPDRIDNAEGSEPAKVLSAQPVMSYNQLSEKITQDAFPPKGCRFSFRRDNLFHQHRKFAGEELPFLISSSMTESAKGTIATISKSAIRLDAMESKVYSYPSAVDNGLLHADFHLGPAGSLLFYYSNHILKGYPGTSTIAGNTKSVAGKGVEVRRSKEDASNVDFCGVSVKGKAQRNIYFIQAVNTVPGEYGFASSNPQNTSVQYKGNILDRNTFKTGGFTAAYHFSVSDKFNYSTMKPVAGRPEFFSMKVNEQQVRAIPCEWRLDRSFGVCTVGDMVKQRANTVETNVTSMSMFAEIEPIYATDDSVVVPENEGWGISTPVERLTLGSWKKQKQPFYSWDAFYTKEYDVKDTSKSYAIQLNTWGGTVTEIYVNREKAGVIGSNSYRLNIASYLKQGKDQVEVCVVGSHKSLLSPRRNNPNPGLASPQHWKDIRKQVPGSDYQTLDYGLMEGFDLVY